MILNNYNQIYHEIYFDNIRIWSHKVNNIFINLVKLRKFYQNCILFGTNVIFKQALFDKLVQNNQKFLLF